MSRLPAVFHQIKDATGQPVSGGKLYTYVAGSTTNKATYPSAADLAALTNANANPLTAGADGIVGPMFLLTNGAYKFVEKTAAGATLRTEDQVWAGLLASNSLVTRVSQIASSPLDYGAIGDGVANETSYVQSALNAATGVVDLLGKTFRVDSSLSIPSSITLRNGNFNLANSSSLAMIGATGTLGSHNALTANASYRDGLVSVTSAAGLAAGDIISIYDSRAYTDSAVRGEIAEVRSISVLDINLRNLLLDAYATASTAGIKKITPKTDIRLENLHITGAASVSGTSSLLQFIHCRRLQISGVTLDTYDNYGLRLEGCYEVNIERTWFKNGSNTGLFIGGGAFINIDRCGFVGNAQNLTAKAPTTGAGVASGPVRYLTISNSSFTYGGTGTTAQLIIQQDAQFVKILGNNVSVYSTGAIGAVEIYSTDTTFSGNSVYTAGTGAIGLFYSYIVPDRSGHNYFVSICDNEMMGGASAANGVFLISNASTPVAGRVDSIVVDNNTSDAVMEIAPSTSTTGTLRVSRNNVTAIQLASSLTENAVLSDNSCNLMTIAGTGGPVMIRGGVVHGNAAQTMIDVTGTTDIIIDGVVLKPNTNTIGISLSASTVNAQVRNVVMTADVSSKAIYADECTKVAIANCSLRSTSAGVEVDNTTQAASLIEVINNVITASTRAIEVDHSASTCPRLTVSGNNIEAGTGVPCIEITGRVDRFAVYGNVNKKLNDTDANILITGDAAGSIAQGILSGNSLANGTYGISASNVSAVYAGPNVYESMATGTFTGLSNQTYSVTNLTTDRTYDADTAVVTETNDVLGTLIGDLRTLGVVL